MRDATLFPVVLTLVLGACGPALVEIDDSDSVEPISPDTDIAPDPTTPPDTDTPDPTDPPEAADWYLSGDLVVSDLAEVPSGDVLVVLFDASETGCCRVWAQAVVGPISPGAVVPFTIGLPDEPPGEWFVADPYQPEMEVAAFSVGAYVDEDGDGLATEADTFVAAQFDYLAYLRGTLSADAEAGGAALGWNDVALIGTVTPFSGDHTVSEVPASLLPDTPTAALTATIVPPLVGAGDKRVDLYSVNEFLGLPVAVPTLTSVAAADASPNQLVVLPAPLPVPPADHYADDLGDGPIDGAELAVYAAVAYLDSNGDGAWQLASEVPLASTDGPAPEAQTLLVHARATGFEARLLAFYVGMGWSILADDPYDPYDAPTAPWADGLLLE